MDRWLNTSCTVSIACALATLLAAENRTIADPVLHVSGYAIVNTVDVPAEVSGNFGDLLFSADGDTAYFINSSESVASAVWTAPVNRDVDGTVLSFGVASFLFAEVYIDTGLEFAPGTSTLFFRGLDEVEDNYSIAWRLPDGTVEYGNITNYDAEYGGMAFLPDRYPNANGVVSTSYYDESIYYHSVVSDGAGSYVVGEGELYAAATGALGDAEFIATGALADSLLVAVFDGTLPPSGLYYIEIDNITGLPVEGSSPTMQPFLTEVVNAWGVAIDPITDNIWMIPYASDRAMTQIAWSDQTICEGDANGDGTVDPLDSGYVLARFGCSVGTGDASCDAADQNGDGAVDPLDSGFVLARFGTCE